MRLVRENWYRDVWLLLTTAAVAWAVTLAFSTARESHDSLCALRADLQRRVASSEQFLQENPHGTPGIPPKFILTSVDGQRRTIRALRGLDCSG